jgi:catechol 2,3-dioxygenase-like lactoylglutathione lyase family enzyme
VSAWTIAGTRHGGITVSDLDRSLEFYCVFVTGIDALYEDLLARGVSFRSDGPVEMTAGANAGGKSLYSLDPDGYVFEFHQRPPQ